MLSWKASKEFDRNGFPNLSRIIKNLSSVFRCANTGSFAAYDPFHPSGERFATWGTLYSKNRLSQASKRWPSKHFIIKRAFKLTSMMLSKKSNGQVRDRTE